MKKRRYSALIAGIIYLQFAFFAAAVLYLWLGNNPSLDLLPTIDGAVELLSVITALMVASLVLGAWLTFRGVVNVGILVSSLAMVVVALWWNVLAVVFWLAPIPFLWVSYRASNDD